MGDLEAVKRDIRALLISSAREGLTVGKLCRDYELVDLGVFVLVSLLFVSFLGIFYFYCCGYIWFYSNHLLDLCFQRAHRSRHQLPRSWRNYGNQFSRRLQRRLFCQQHFQSILYRKYMRMRLTVRHLSVLNLALLYSLHMPTIPPRTNIIISIYSVACPPAIVL